MAGGISAVTVLVVVVVAVIAGLDGADAASYTVGGTSGWQTPSSTTFYSDWASSITFSVGDTLVFNFVTGVHDVAVATSQDVYTNCGPASSPITTGPATVTLNTTGTHYYFCTISNHCSRGQKLAVTVGSTSTPSTPSPSGSPPTTGSTSSPPPPPPSSSSAGLGVGLATMFTSIVMGYLALSY